jgi:hypothetical protein
MREKNMWLREIFQDNENHLSSKRVFGAIVISLALYLTIYLVHKGMVNMIPQLTPLYTLGGGLMGLGVAEIRKK